MTRSSIGGRKRSSNDRRGGKEIEYGKIIAMLKNEGSQVRKYDKRIFKCEIKTAD